MSKTNNRNLAAHERWRERKRIQGAHLTQVWVDEIKAWKHVAKEAA